MGRCQLQKADGYASNPESVRAQGPIAAFSMPALSLRKGGVVVVVLP